MKQNMLVVELPAAATVLEADGRMAEKENTTVDRFLPLTEFTGFISTMMTQTGGVTSCHMFTCHQEVRA